MIDFGEQWLNLLSVASEIIIEIAFVMKFEKQEQASTKYPNTHSPSFLRLVLLEPESLAPFGLLSAPVVFPDLRLTRRPDVSFLCEASISFVSFLILKLVPISNEWWVAWSVSSRWDWCLIDAIWSERSIESMDVDAEWWTNANNYCECRLLTCVGCFSMPILLATCPLDRILRRWMVCDFALAFGIDSTFWSSVHEAYGSKSMYRECRTTSRSPVSSDMSPLLALDASGWSVLNCVCIISTDAPGISVAAPVSNLRGLE